MSHQDQALESELSELRRENAFLKDILRNLPNQVMVINQNNDVMMANPPALVCMSVNPDETPDASLTAPLKIDFPFDELPDPGQTQVSECFIDGASKWINQYAFTLNQLGDTLKLFIGEDITRFLEVEKALKIRENRIKAILDNAVEGIITIDDMGNIETFNPAAAQIFGYATSDVIGRNVKMLMPEPYHSEHDGYINNFLNTGVGKIIGHGREVVGRRKDGSIFPMHLAVSTVNIEQKNIFTGIVRDLSEYKRLQDEIARSHHLALVGEMAATIAHEIRNPLAGISGALQIIQGDLSPDDPHAEILREVWEQVVRLSKSVNDLLMFTKKWEPVRQHCVLAELVNKVSRTAAMELDFEKIRWQVDVNPDSWAYVDPGLVEQILWNLFQNARDACSGDGLLKISLIESQDNTDLIVTDDGPGIEPHILKDIFKPFFTTKTQGTGLGLPITKRIMEAHGGDVRVISEIGRGTEITLSFPRPKEH